MVHELVVLLAFFVLVELLWAYNDDLVRENRPGSLSQPCYRLMMVFLIGLFFRLRVACTERSLELPEKVSTRRQRLARVGIILVIIRLRLQYAPLTDK